MRSGARGVSEMRHPVVKHLQQHRFRFGRVLGRKGRGLTGAVKFEHRLPATLRGNEVHVSDVDPSPEAEEGSPVAVSVFPEDLRWSAILCRRDVEVLDRFVDARHGSLVLR